MNSSGIKRGLATTAIAALAITGVPAIANAEPLSQQTAADAVEFYAPLATPATVSDKNDGTNTSASLVVGGGVNVTSVQFQYEVATAVGTWVDVPGGLVSRNADGVFSAEFSAIPANLTQVRAVPNTGLQNVASKIATLVPAASAQTVELASEGALGVFQAPYTVQGRDGDYVGVTGTASANTTDIDVTDASNGTLGGAVAADIATPASGATSTTFDAVLDIAGYDYSADNSANQIAINAATPNTDDAEGSTLYVQTIGSIDATPATQERANAADSEITVTVLDTTGQPVAGAQVGIADLDTDGTGPDTDGPDTILGYTDANGQFVDDSQTTVGTFTYFVNTTNNPELQTVDFSDTASVTTYTPAFASITTVNERNRTTFDLDELADGDDFTVEVDDQRGNPFTDANRVPQYRYNFTPAGGGATVEGTYANVGTQNADGSYNVPAPANQGAGTYVLEVRRPAFQGTGFAQAAPVTFTAAQSVITFTDGAQAIAPVNGEYTVTGNLSSSNAAGTDLAGRRIEVVYTPAGDSSLAPQASQPAGVTRNSATSATVITDANGNFSVTLTDPDVPGNVTPTPENGTVTATAFEAANDPTPLGTTGSVTVRFQQAATVSRIEVDSNEVFGDAAPGKPVELNVTVYGTDNDTNPANDPILTDYPVSFEADKGFFSTDTVDGIGVDENDLVLDSDNDDEGDLFGFYEDLGDEETVSTNELNNGNSGAGIIAAIERDEDFDDDGLSEMTVTVTAGGVSEDVEVQFDSRDYLNLGEVALTRAAGEPAGDVTVGDEVDFQLTAKDQFGNLVGDQFASISDDTPVADVTTDGDFGGTLTDFANDNAGITATSTAPVVQTLIARLTNVSEALVDDNGNIDEGFRTVTESSDPINWVAEEPPVVDPEPEVIRANLSANNNGAKPDRLKVTTGKAASAGATVKFFRIKANGGSVQVGQAVLGADGSVKKNVKDINGKRFTKYFARVLPTETSLGDRSNNTRVR